MTNSTHAIIDDSVRTCLKKIINNMEFDIIFNMEKDPFLWLVHIIIKWVVSLSKVTFLNLDICRPKCVLRLCNEEINICLLKISRFKILFKLLKKRKIKWVILLAIFGLASVFQYLPRQVSSWQKFVLKKWNRKFVSH